MSKLERPSDTYAIIGAAMEVYNHLGGGFLEAVYQEALELELSATGVPYVAQAQLTLQYKSWTLKHHYIADLVCFGNIIVELKAVDTITEAHRAQLLNYLSATQYPLGLLINFGQARRLEWDRKIFTPVPARDKRAAEPSS